LLANLDDTIVAKVGAVYVVVVVATDRTTTIVADAGRDGLMVAGGCAE
jgi:hypothetical protein